MRLATSIECREIDSLAQRAYKIPAEVLMESAGALAAREIEQSFYPEINKGKIAVVCGPGNNGGDGLVLARHLHSSGYRDITVFISAPALKQSELFKLQFERVKNSGVRVIDLLMEKEKLDQLKSSSLLVDGLFGTGLKNSIEGDFARLIDAMNAARAPVVSLDTPSGLDCDRGVVLGTAVKAAMTITFGLAKPGFFVADGPAIVGRLRTFSIGFPYELLRGVATTHFAFTERLMRRALPRIKNNTHKSSYGHLLVLAGSEGTWGAAHLASSSAYRIGAGYVTLASTQLIPEVLIECPEVLTAPLNKSLWEKEYSAIAIGPGLGLGPDVVELIKELKQKKFTRVVVDADAITVAAQNDLFPFPESWIITPHPGELARILDVSANEINEDRYHFSRLAAQVTGCHVLLKGFRSILAYGQKTMVIMAGNSALAKAGSGDVLTGMIGGLLAQGLLPLQATAAAAFIHGRLADEWVKGGNDKRSLNPSDLRDHLPTLMARLRDGTLS